MGKQLGCAVLFFILIALALAPSAWAEMQVLESNVPEFRVGARIPDADQMPLPAGGRVKVLVLPANETRVFRGAAERDTRDIPFGGTRGLKTAPRN